MASNFGVKPFRLRSGRYLRAVCVREFAFKMQSRLGCTLSPAERICIKMGSNSGKDQPSGSMCDASVTTVERQNVKRLGTIPLNSSSPRSNVAAPVHRGTPREKVVNITCGEGGYFLASEDLGRRLDYSFSHLCFFLSHFSFFFVFFLDGD